MLLAEKVAIIISLLQSHFKASACKRTAYTKIFIDKAFACAPVIVVYGLRTQDKLIPIAIGNDFTPQAKGSLNCPTNIFYKNHTRNPTHAESALR
jgi:hypothetical protein